MYNASSLFFNRDGHPVAGAGRPRHQAPVSIDYVALDQTDRLAA